MGFTKLSVLIEGIMEEVKLKSKCTNPQCSRPIPQIPYPLSCCCVVCLDWQVIPEKAKGLHGERKHTAECNIKNRIRQRKEKEETINEKG